MYLQTAIIMQANTFTLGASTLFENSFTGTDSVVLATSHATDTWTASTNVAWLHLTDLSQNGFGSINIIFYLDANLGTNTRTGTLTIADQTLTITQAGSNYVSALGPVFTVISNGLSTPSGVVADSVGNLYIADTSHNMIKKIPAGNTNIITMVSSGLNRPNNLAVDGNGNVYIADTGNNAIKEWVAANSNVVTLVSSGLSSPKGVAVDSIGNVYIADTSNNAIKVWTVTDSNVNIIVSSGLNLPNSVAVDIAGNVYISDTFNSSIKKWSPANSNITTLVSSGLNAPRGITIDGRGNVLIADYVNNALKEWNAATGNLITLVQNPITPLPTSISAIALDGYGNIYYADPSYNAIRALPVALVDQTTKLESIFSGNDALLTMLPPTQKLLNLFLPSTDQSWLTITGITNGVVSFSFSATVVANRTAKINLLGVKVPVTQYQVIPLPISLGTTNIVEPPYLGTDSVVLAVSPLMSTWTATNNATWLHLNPSSQNGIGNTNIVFTFDTNTGATRTGTITIAGQTLTVTQAGSNYVASPLVLVPLVSSGLNSPQQLAVDNSGNVYIADVHNNAIKEWVAATSNVVTLVASDLFIPHGVAVDIVGNVYIADTGNNAIKMWSPIDSSVTTLLSSGLNSPFSVAIDGAGNVYIADTGNNAIKKIQVGSTNIVKLVTSGLSSPQGVAVDAAGNVYIADFNNGLIKELPIGNTNVMTLFSFGGVGVAADSSGNVYGINSPQFVNGRQQTAI